MHWHRKYYKTGIGSPFSNLYLWTRTTHIWAQHIQKLARTRVEMEHQRRERSDCLFPCFSGWEREMPGKWAPYFLFSKLFHGHVNTYLGTHIWESVQLELKWSSRNSSKVATRILLQWTDQNKKCDIFRTSISRLFKRVVHDILGHNIFENLLNQSWNNPPKTRAKLLPVNNFFFLCFPFLFYFAFLF